MCGITGFIASETFSEDKIKEICTNMTNSLLHRGPDDSGVWVTVENHVALGQRRLSIVDLSPEGHQPMHSHCGRYSIVFNGEVYNFLDIRRQLESQGTAPKWRGHSDTEIMLAAIVAWGLRAAVEKFVGMFAFALYDKKENKLFLVRDRLGVKPLYYGWVNNDFVFASELKAIKAHYKFTNKLNVDSLALYFRHNYIPAPYSIYKDIYKLETGYLLEIAIDTVKNKAKDYKLNKYWSAQDVWLNGAANQWQASEEELVDNLEQLLLDAVNLRMIADVPLGAFLSGGIDSSLVVSLMQAQSSLPVKTFSIGFQEDQYNEAKYAKEVAKHLGTNHTELYVTPQEALDVIPLIPHYWDEPFSDSSQIPTYLVSKLARKHVTVSLSGDGGDELFAGYTRYFAAADTWQKLNKPPYSIIKPIAKMAQKVPINILNLLTAPLRTLSEKAGYSGPIGDKLHSVAGVLNHESFMKFYQYFISHDKNPGTLVNGSKEPSYIFSNPSKDLTRLDQNQLMSLLDIMLYLPDDILTKVDRASMAVSLEARVPILDHRVVEFAAKIPTDVKIKDGKGKWPLRQILYKYVPQELIERPKMGFGVPIDRWLRNELKDWAGDLLNENKLKQQGFLDEKQIQKMWKEHLSQERDWHYYLWDVLMFQAWLEEQK